MLLRFSEIENAKQDHHKPKTTIQMVTRNGCYLFVQEGQQD
ncbi:hypothetical protein NG800_013900 [Epilithonimonas ginsengisoli]|uniref:Uncharacterized protein n=1 Tax=Epilithonimonas ginsengisoli TaxID=1245592 RepID=A0ABU4JKB8_9FLAO|nr:hypothetical protein [Epilithonimonas ginsengisoli]MDW8550014.1 hypothetical protein [Epilithonimonas ginsengisoli]